MKVQSRPKKLAKNAVVQVIDARAAGGYKLRVRFSDKSSRTIDFGKFLQASKNPLIRAWLDPDRFAEFTVRDGDLMWGDYELCFPVADLYENNI